MTTEPPFLRQHRRLAGLAATLALHLALLWMWQLSRRHADEADVPVDRIQWVNVQPKKAVKVPPPVAAAPPEARPAAARAAVAQPPPVRIAAPSPAPAEPVAEAPPAKGHDEILADARRDIGKISKELGKEFPGPKIRKPRDTPWTRLEKGIELANELAPPKWYEAPKIKELVDSGSYGRKRYRVITALGTYCITYESNHAPDGIDVISKGMQQKKTTCPQHDLPPTKQEGLE
jgi:hypothetical protein